MSPNDPDIRAFFDTIPHADLSRLGSAVISALPVAVIAYRTDGRCVLANEAAARMIGGPLDQVLAQNFRQLKSWKDSGMLAAAEAALADGRTEHIETECLSSFGKRFSIEIDFSPFEMAGERLLWMVGRDVTPQKQAEAELRASQERLQSLYELSPLGIALTDMTGHYIDFNRAFLGFTGYSADELRALDYWTLTPREYDAAETRQLRALTETGHYGPYEKEYRRKDGTRIPLRLNGVLVTGADGSRYIWSIVEDITAWVETRDHLHRLVGDLDASNRELEQFAYVASHDLREPLRMIGSYLALLDRRYGVTLDADAREFLAFAIDGARRMDAMVLDLLEFSRIGRTADPFAPLALDDIVAAALDNLDVAIRETGAVITVARPLPTVTGARSEMLRLMQNLIGNALKYRAPDRTPAVTIATAEDDTAWTLSVADNGIGIPEGDRERIFDIFQRLHTRDEYEGTGIGLAICRKVVEHHGGRIRVESQPGVGSTFTITLPRR
ncbi:MAG: PAS domain S-box protein [Magnetospirillum sp.]|nr:PAS domain S-box protein [Magnetospirillum sp.]